MADLLSPETYFDLESEPLAALFEGCQYAWEALAHIEEYIEKNHAEQLTQDNVHEFPQVHIGEGTVIAPGAHIEGPALIGKNCTIGHGAFIRGGTVIADNVHIGHAVEIKHCIILSGAAVAHLNYIGDSIVGRGANISGGAIVANFRLDKKPVVVRSGDNLVETGMEKLGAIIGDGCNVGVNAVLNPGTFLGKQTVVYPLTSVSGLCAADSIIR
jgi:NDP-sugar pyrophosphorylase family protein